LGDQGQVGVIEMEVTRQLGGRGLARGAAIAPLLVRSQKIDGHPGSSLGRAWIGKGRSVVESKAIL
jgi:hypothetical protein